MHLLHVAHTEVMVIHLAHLIKKQKSNSKKVITTVITFFISVILEIIFVVKNRPQKIVNSPHYYEAIFF